MTPFEKYLQSLCCPYLTPLTLQDTTVHWTLLIESGDTSENIYEQDNRFMRTFGD